jgi:hypothetical protein
MDAAAGAYPPGDPGASGAGHDRALPGLSEAFQTGPIRAAESGQRSGQALRAAALMPVASPFDRRVIWVGGIVFALLIALSPRYRGICAWHLSHRCGGGRRSLCVLGLVRAGRRRLSTIVHRGRRAGCATPGLAPPSPGRPR